MITAQAVPSPFPPTRGSAAQAAQSPHVVHAHSITTGHLKTKPPAFRVVSTLGPYVEFVL
jgi:hypothetical protein